jgi:hypothetical protein
MGGIADELEAAEGSSANLSNPDRLNVVAQLSMSADVFVVDTVVTS